MKVTPAFVPAIGDHGRRPPAPAEPKRGPFADRAAGRRADATTFPGLVSASRPDGAEKSTTSPAQLAQAEVLAAGTRPTVPFGWIVSAIARGLDVPTSVTPAEDTTPPAESDDAPEIGADPPEAAVEQVAGNVGADGAEDMADILDELVDSPDATA